MISAVIFNLLSTTTAVTDLVDTRIYPISAPLNAAYPLVNITTVSTTPTNTKDGGSVVDTSRVQIDVYAKEHSESGAIAKLIRQALDGYHGNFDGHRINRIYFERESESFDSEQRLYRISTDYFIRENL